MPRFGGAFFIRGQLNAAVIARHDALMANCCADIVFSPKVSVQVLFLPSFAHKPYSMRYLKIISVSTLLFVLFFSTTTQFTACTKDVETDTLVVRDTLTIRDTLTVRDTVLVDCNCYDLKDGLVAWYNFKGGNLNDSSGENNHITFNNASKTADRFGNANGAYLFDGSSSYMKVANSASLNPVGAITLSAVVKVSGFYDGICKSNQILGKSSSNDHVNGFYALRFGNIDCTAPLDVTKEWFHGAYGDNASQNTGSAASDTSFIKTGVWYHVVYTYENGVSKVYVNGELKGRREKVVTFTPNNADLYIGRHIDAQYPYLFNGVVDEIRIYKKVLCYGEVKQLYRLK